MPAGTISRKQPMSRLAGIERSPETHEAHQAANHRARKRNVEGLFLAAFWFGNVQDPSSEIDMLDPSALQRIRTTARQKQKKMKLSADRIRQSPKIVGPGSKLGS